MGFEDTYRLSAHAVITNGQGEVLQLRATYGDKNWGLPGGALDPGETIHEALLRECREELGRAVRIEYLSGVYYHSVYRSHVFIFRAHFSDTGEITLSDEHSDAAYFPLEALSPVQRQRVRDCLEFNGWVHSAKF
ncbi:NUDIX hydrolase [Microbulbifer thermotolerans]|uniref:NUDIX domain-containing protein n=1 Tax=Microbulbifer thermotolerans TaxID=252514 RepID=A0A143HJR7_MICTH|nr:NUDIX domain-containing protein [Microbulbifer thermotolerans]AMX01959.1 NUDIX hydrolase [Microbulbifer thermotolerans]MCX2780517.1 NUDIX domain-containing protein [Microbulbifer thermotolerans]MCX2783186.1 NUDIX domain-containing protein [Microbulbifer thermotolerans]MCX2794212.1 NUDIX domain-containing protein [Microbulbifer thermotolerans]MCX2800766.1 NUDIX domain-containing protein [Microbulbifer thermotolerans]